MHATARAIGGNSCRVGGCKSNFTEIGQEISIAMDPRELFANLTPDSLPEWASVEEVLSSIESELGEDARIELESMLDGHDLPDRVNVRELLSDIQEELGEPYFDKFLQGEDNNDDED